MPDIHGDDFEAQLAAFLPQTPQDHIALLERAKSQLRAMLAEARPNVFVIALRTDAHPRGIFVAHSDSFGYYPGSLLNAAHIIPPFNVNLHGFLVNGVEPKPEPVLLRNAFAEAFATVEEEINHWKGQL